MPGCSRVGVRDEAVVVRALHPFIHDTAGPSACHVRTKNRALVGEGARLDGIAARLGEEDRQAVVGGQGLQVRVPGGRVAAVAAPFVGVEAEEVDVLRRGRRAREVVLECRAQGGDVCCAVANGDGAVVFEADVGFDVCDGGFDVGCCGRAGWGVDDFVADPEAGEVRVAYEGVEDLCEGLELGYAPGGAVLLDGRVEGVEVEPDVDPQGGEY